MNDASRIEFNHILAKLRHPEKRTWIILNPTSIGDTAMVCALAQAFVKEHGYGITMVVPSDHLPITDMYPGRFEQVLTAERAVMIDIMQTYLPTHQFELDMPFCGHPYDIGDGRTDELGYLFKYPGRGGLNFNDMIRHALRLPWDACIERPTIPEAWVAQADALALSVGMKYQRSVILFPATSTALAQLPDVLWSAVAARLNALGYQVFCNMKGGNFRPSTMPIAGTIPIEVPLHLALPLVSWAGRMISRPNGLQFLQLLGGRFEHMTVMIPASSHDDDYQVNGRRYSVIAGMAQFMYPEMCVGIPFSEFVVPHEGTDEELQRIAIAVADMSVDDPSYFSRYASGDQRYVDENADWLSSLIDPLTL